MPLLTTPTRTTQSVQPTAVAFAAFTATHPRLPFWTALMSAGTVTIHLHGPQALVHLAHWEAALGNCARSNDSFPARTTRTSSTPSAAPPWSPARHSKSSLSTTEPAHTTTTT